MTNITHLGIDIAKATFDVTVCMTSKSSHNSFTNNQAGFKKLSKWLNKFDINQLHACMEATGTYGDALANYLYVQDDCIVSVVNPLQIKSFGQTLLKRNKNDQIDSQLVAQYCEKFNPNPWQPLPEKNKMLQALVRRRNDVKNVLNQENNRLSTADKCIKSFIKTVIKTYNKQLKKIEAEIQKTIKSDETLKKQNKLIISIKGIGDHTSAQFLATIGDVSRFDKAKQVAAFVGLTPRQHQSGTSIRGKTRLSKKGHADLRAALYFPAMCAMRFNPVIKQFANKLKENGLNGKAVVCAVMRKLLHIIWGVLKSNKPFDINYAENC